MKFISILSILIFSLGICNKELPPKTLSPAEEIIYRSIDAHGGDRFEDAHFEFIFRTKKYSFRNEGENYEYQVKYEKDGRIIHDVLNNDGITHSIDGRFIELSDKEAAGYSESINSVIYFATLPHKLRDKAANFRIMDDATIKDQKYHVMKVTFDQEGGGEDYDDTFHYWINKKTNIVDYLAYNYKVNNGGVRFRSAYNGRVVGGILFQDYVNYKAEVGTPLIELPALWEQGKLKELSRIETENVRQK